MITLLFPGYRPAVAVNIVSNGGFETGNLTEWNLTDNKVFKTTVDANPHTGTWAAEFANTDYDAILAQTLTDVIGDNYTFSFWLKTDGQTSGDFSALFDTTVLLTESNPAATAYTQFSYTVVGTGSDTISFKGLDKPGDIYLDDVSVTAASSPTPEPSTIMLTGLGCIGVLASRRRFNAPLRSRL